MFQDAKGVFRSLKSKKDRQYNGWKKRDKKGQTRSTKHYTKSHKSSNTNVNPSKNAGEIGSFRRVNRNGYAITDKLWHNIILVLLPSFLREP
jgi:hypothetical protein